MDSVMNEVDPADAEDLTSDVSNEVLETAAKNEALPAGRGSVAAKIVRVEQPTDWLSPYGFISNYLGDEPGRRFRRPSCSPATRLGASPPNIAQAAGAAPGAPPIRRGVTRLQRHISRQSAQCRLL